MEKYVIIQNTGETPKRISDPRGTMIDLTGAGKHGDSVKVILDERSEDVYNLAIRKYNSMRQIPGLRITFSENVVVEHRVPKLVITSTAEQEAGTAKRADVMRQKIKEEALNKNRNDARLKRARAQAELNKELRESGIPSEEVKQATAKRAKAEKAAKKAGKIERKPNLDDDSIINDESVKGTPVTADVLAAMDDSAIKEVLKQLNIQVTERQQREELVQLILKKLEE